MEKETAFNEGKADVAEKTNVSTSNTNTMNTNSSEYSEIPVGQGNTPEDVGNTTTKDDATSTAGDTIAATAAAASAADDDDEEEAEDNDYVDVPDQPAVDQADDEEKMEKKTGDADDDNDYAYATTDELRLVKLTSLDQYDNPSYVNDTLTRPPQSPKSPRS